MALTSKDAATDKLAIAEQVIVSAGNILVAAGFQREDIASFFRQAADLLAPGEAAGAQAPDLSPRSAPEPKREDELKAEFGKLEAVRALETLMTTMHAMELRHGGPEARQAGLALAMTMVPHIAAAQNWLREAAEQSGCAIVADRRHWREAASDDDLAKAGATLFLDEYEAVYHPAFAWLTEVAETLARHGQERDFSLLLIHLVDNNISPTCELKEAMEMAVQAFAVP